MIITHSLPPHVNDFYEKLMMLKCPLRERKEWKWREMVREKERDGGWEGREEKLARYTKAEVGVVFPVNTELQRVRGERFSDGYAEEHAA